MENKTGKYLKYAIGEIVLVAIGILIALEVNNYNQTKIKHSYEHTMLVELQKAIESDINFFEGHLLNKRNVRLREVHNYFKKMIMGDEVDESLFSKNLLRLQYGNRFHVNNGAYESIKSSGLNNISDTEIRNYISQLYEFDIPRFNSLVNYSTEALIRVVNTDLPFLIKTVAVNNNGEVIIEEIPTDFNVKTNPHFLRLLKQSIDLERTSNKTYKNLVTKYKKLNQMINEKLDINV